MTLTSPTVQPEGFVHPQFAEVGRYFAGLFGPARGGGGSLVVRRHGETVVDLWKGYADPGGHHPWTRDTLAIGFSTTKGVAATVIHRLADRGLLGYDEPVATYWPEFAANGKARITVREVMSHRAGLHSLRAVAHRADDVFDHLRMEDRLAATAAERGPCPPAYHALTYGWLLAGLARHITGRGMAELVRTELGIPGMHIGAPPRGSAEVAHTIGLQPLLLAAAGKAIPAPVLARIPLPARRLPDALLTPALAAVYGPRPRILATEMPAANGVFTAAALATLYSALANGGEVDGRRLLSAATVHQIGRVQTRDRDRVLGLRVRWRLGYHQAISFGARSSTAFGHYGYGGPGGWADPTTGLSMGFVTNKLGARTTPIGDIRLFRLTGLALNAATSNDR